MVAMVAIPIDIEKLAEDKRASLAAHHLAAELHAAAEELRSPNMAQLQGWLERWQHAAIRVASDGPNAEGATVIVNGKRSAELEDLATVRVKES